MVDSDNTVYSNSSTIGTVLLTNFTSNFSEATAGSTGYTESYETYQTSNTTRSFTDITTLTNVIQETTKSVQLSLFDTTRMEPNATTNSTEEPYDEFKPPEGVEYIFVPLGVMVFVIILSAVVLVISRKRKLERLRHRLMPLYNFDPGEEGEDDWETELLDEGFESRQKRQGYRSMDVEENAELFSGH